MVQQEKIARPYHHGDLRGALLVAAADLLEKDGAEALSFRAVSRAVGVSQTAPYNHFENKEALLVALAGEGFAELRQSQEDALIRLPDGADGLEALGLDYVRFATARPQRYRLMFGVGLKDRGALAPIAHVKRSSFGPLRGLLEGRMEHPDPAMLDSRAVAAWGLVHGLASLIIDGSLPSLDAAEAGDRSRVARAIAAFSSMI